MSGETESNPVAAPSVMLWTALSRAHALIQGKAAADVARYDLTAAEFGVLGTVYRNGPMALGEIQGELLVSSGGITYLVDRLERRGIVKRRAAPEDRRVRHVELTRKGMQLIQEIFPQHAQRLEQLLSGLTSREQLRTTALLERLRLHAQQVQG
jgi:MarR family 2-MHQ and catechol resistance regulon transcriptional repressor